MWSAITGPHCGLGEGTDRAVRYRPEYAPFAGLRDAGDDRSWADLARLIGPDEPLAVAGPDLTAPAGWSLLTTFDGWQMVATGSLAARSDPEAVVLGEADVEELTDLVARTEPGPFRSQTWRMGTYLGLRVEGRLVAMAGERMRLPGWTEISAVCTDPDFRGRGLAARLIRVLAARIRDRGDQPMMHVLMTNTGAIRLYEHLGFAVHRPMRFLVVQPPGSESVTALF